MENTSIEFRIGEALTSDVITHVIAYNDEEEIKLRKVGFIKTGVLSIGGENVNIFSYKKEHKMPTLPTDWQKEIFTEPNVFRPAIQPYQPPHDFDKWYRPMFPSSPITANWDKKDPT